MQAAKLRNGALVEVVEIRHLEAERRVRGRLAEPRGWISICNTQSGYRWAERLEEGPRGQQAPAERCRCRGGKAVVGCGLAALALTLLGGFIGSRLQAASDAGLVREYQAVGGSTGAGARQPVGGAASGSAEASRTAPPMLGGTSELDGADMTATGRRARPPLPLPPEQEQQETAAEELAEAVWSRPEDDRPSEVDEGPTELPMPALAAASAAALAVVPLTGYGATPSLSVLPPAYVRTPSLGLGLERYEDDEDEPPADAELRKAAAVASVAKKARGAGWSLAKAIVDPRAKRRRQGPRGSGPAAARADPGPRMGLPSEPPDRRDYVRIQAKLAATGLAGRAPVLIPAAFPRARPSSEPLRSTPDGICMYELPSRFNVQHPGILDAGKALLQPEPHLKGLFGTRQAMLDRIFYDRMLAAATNSRLPASCALFYVPYFALGGGGPGAPDAKSAQLDAELLQHLPHFQRQAAAPGSDHFVVLGQPVAVATGFLKNIDFQHVIKLAVEDTLVTTSPDRWRSIHAIPYPTWFRYDPSLEPDGLQRRFISRGALTSRLRGCQEASWQEYLPRCNGARLCSIPVTQGPCGRTASLPLVTGSYTCSTREPGSIAQVVEILSRVRRRLVMGCNAGPCWLWGDCAGHLGSDMGKDPAGAAPMVTFIRTARGKGLGSQADASAWRQMCLERPGSCTYAEWDEGEDLAIPNLAELMTTSLFCLSPPTGKVLFDALAYGCIPVVAATKPLSRYFWHLPDWQAVSIVIPAADLLSRNESVVDWLVRMAREHPADVRRKKLAIRSAAYSLQYSVEPHVEKRGADAFQVTLKKLLERSAPIG